MSTPIEPTLKPIHSSVKWLSVLLLISTLVLLILGGLTTSRRAGMDDPVWPTEPWYIIVNGEIWQEKQTGFLLEHTHRYAGWTAGLVASILAFAAWLSGPNKRQRLFPLLSLFAVLMMYGWLHGQMMVAQAQREATGTFRWPMTPILATSAAALLFAGSVLHHLLGNDRGRWVRAVVSLLLLAVMVQGMLGGLRVFLDKTTGLKNTLGVELSQLHGLFAQVIFSVMCCLPILCAVRRPFDTLTGYDRHRLRWLSIGLVATVLLQLIWAVWIRHAPTPLAQRLHILTAFAVTGMLLWLTLRGLASAQCRKQLATPLVLLLVLLVVQLTLGVEAWMGKFSATGPDAATPPMDRPITTMNVLIRTSHQMVGALLLATASVVLFRVLRRPWKLAEDETPFQATRPQAQ